MSCSATQQAKEEIVINLQERGADIAPSMYGVFLKKLIMLEMEACMLN